MMTKRTKNHTASAEDFYLRQDFWTRGDNDDDEEAAAEAADG